MPDPNNYTPLDEVEEWVANIVALQDGWPPNGGAVDPANNGGLLNWPLLQLASRTLWLKAQQAQLALDFANLDVSTQINAAIDALINGAPAALDTLSELAAALQNSDDQVAALIAQISGKLAKDANLSDLQDLTAAQVNLGLKGGAFLDVSNNPDLSVDGTELPTRAAVAGAIGANIVEVIYTSSAVLNATIPIDNSIPQNTEGTELLSVTITPSTATSKIRITVLIGVTQVSNSAVSICGALFKDTDAGASYANSIYCGDNGQVTGGLTLDVIDSPATTLPITYKLRAGPSAGSMTPNTRFAGKSPWRMIAEEIRG